ncbi:hypothetical protein M7I_3607 [Glarea lozoyensis 74030]|uniref:Uncharacterized protein n=1 Tax=Glarea lozoyensis (strain ATCC 74030 / MF5533) TaxID=1104152 RepID=H0ELY2_GLAL7|nr:hypothetical protein M7I_3607 [Glarea lozoyensis 74030]
MFYDHVELFSRLWRSHYNISEPPQRTQALIEDKATPEVVAPVTDLATGVSDATVAGADTSTVGGEAGSAVFQTASKVPVFDMTASGTTAGANAAHQAILDGAVAFSKWAATETIKQALFYAGMKGVEALFHASSSSSKDPAVTAMGAKIQKTNVAVAALHATTHDWSDWSTAHYDKKGSYGSVDVMGHKMTHFEIFQYNCGALTDMLNDTVAPALKAFNDSKSTADLDTLRSALLKYCQKVKGQSDSLVKNEQAMVADGLQPHQSDLDKALASLS